MRDDLDVLIADRVGARMDKGRWPGLALAIEHKGTTNSRVFGLADLEHETPVQPKTVFRIGSVTKPFTATLILKLQEMGMLLVEDKVAQHLPDLPSHYHAITIHQLLTHTSGLPSYSTLPEFRRRIREDLSQAEVLALIKNLPLRFEPGTEHEYCNSGYNLLGLIAEQVTGHPYEEAINEHVLQRLGLDHTTYDSTSRIIPNRASGYVWDGEGNQNAPYLSMGLPGAAGGLVSTVGDLLKWQRSLGDGGFLSTQSIAMMRNPTVLSTGEEIPYAYGMGLFEFEGQLKLRHGGGINGFSSIVTSYPTRDLAIAVLTNIGTGWDLWAVESEIARLVLDLPTPASPPVIQLSEERLGAIAGTYLLGDAPVPATKKGGGIMWMGFHYLPIDNSTFVAAEDPESWMTFDAREVDSPRLTRRAQPLPPNPDGRPQLLRITREGVNYVYRSG